MAESDVEVLVIGGGPVGMVFATEMARWNVPFRIVDKKPTTVQHSNAVGIQVRTQEVLDAIGIGPKIQAAGHHQTRLTAFGFGKRLGTIELDAVDSPYRGLLSIGQNITEKVLVEHLAAVGVIVERPVEAIRFEQDADGASVTLRKVDHTEEKVRARWVVSCEGGGSMVRQSLGIPFEGERYQDEVFVQTDCVLRWSYPRGVYMFLNDRLAVIVSPYDDAGYSRVICAMPDPDPSDWTPPTLADMQNLVRRGADPDAELSEPVGWLTRYRTQHKIADRLREGRAFLCGDAGHVHVPIGGQGMNTGMQDAFNLAWKLAHVVKGWALPALLETYNAERHPVAQALIRGTDAGYYTMIQPSRLAEWLVKSAGPVALSFAHVRERLIRATAEIDIAYQPGSIVDDRGGADIAAGARMPDAALVRFPEKTPVSLFDLLRGARWTLLMIAGREPLEAADLLQVRAAAAAGKQAIGDRLESWLVAAEGEIPTPEPLFQIAADRLHSLHRKLGVHRPILLLVRPDWYIGFKGPLGAVEALEAFLSRLAI